METHKCDLCDSQATVHLTQVVEGKVQKLHFCEPCAEKSGVNTEAPISVTDVLLGLGKETMEPTVQASLHCPICMMTRADFKKTTRLGCASCYETFSEDLNALIRAMHHSLEHRGKIPTRQGKHLSIIRKRTKLETNLKKAIAEERFEDAAQLRDELKQAIAPHPEEKNSS